MVASYETKEAVKQILLDITPYLDEKQRRILFGSAAAALGHGGISFVKEVTGSARNTISSGMDEVADVTDAKSSEPNDSTRIRKPGAGRKTALEKNPLLYEKIEEVITQLNPTFSTSAAVASTKLTNSSTSLPTILSAESTKRSVRSWSLAAIPAIKP